MSINFVGTYKRCMGLVVGISLVFTLTSVFAEELFDNRAAKPLSRGTTVASDSTIGGYPIYQGDNQWRFFSSKVDGPNNFGVSYGTLNLLNPDNGNFFVQMSVQANLDQSGRGFFLPSDPCAGEHLVRVNQIRGLGSEGTSGDCLTIDPFIATVNGRQITTLDVRVTNSQSSSRFYGLRILLNPVVLGVAESVVSDWSKEELLRNPDRSKFLGKVTEFGKQLQAAVGLAIGFSKPKDAFKNVPSFRALGTDLSKATTDAVLRPPQGASPVAKKIEDVANSPYGGTPADREKAREEGEAQLRAHLAEIERAQKDAEALAERNKGNMNQPSVGDRLRQLDKLLSDRLITQSEYNIRRQKILDSL